MDIAISATVKGWKLLELIRISEGKIKIALTKEELAAYSLTSESIDYGKEETRLVFRELLDGVKKSMGFDTEGDKVFVQIYTAKDGGCEIFVTRIEPENRKTASKPQKQTFEFGRFEHLLATCRALVRMGYKGRSDAYTGEKNYLLVLHAPTKTVSAYVREFGERLEELPEGYINEHYKPIKKSNAVKTLGIL